MKLLLKPSMQQRPLAWIGPIIPHFGHQLAEFSMRLWPTLRAWPGAVVAFGTHPASDYQSLEHTPPFFQEMLRWFGISEDRVTVVANPTVAGEVFVAPQAEQLGGPPPTADYLDSLDELATRRLGKWKQDGFAYISRAGMHARFAGEAYLERTLASVGVRIIRPERMSLRVQLRAYLSAEHLIFAEGSALHGTQLLGRSLGHVTVLVRMPGMRVAESSLEPRARTLRYLDVTSGLLHGLSTTGDSAHPVGMPVLDEGVLVDELEHIGITLRRHWNSADFVASRDRDISEWLAWELARASPPGSHDVLAQSMTVAGIGWPAALLPPRHPS
jgi:hypothetical protein